MEKRGVKVKTMKKVGLFLIIYLCCVLFNLSLTGNALAVDDGGYEYKGGWGISTDNDKFFNSPKGVAIDSSGNIYVADTANHRIQRFDASGTLTMRWGSFGTGSGQFNLPADVAVGTDCVYVLDTNNNRVQKFTLNGVFVLQWGGYTETKENGKFNYPEGIAVGTDGCVYVADTENCRVQKFNSSGAFVKTWGSYGTTLASGKFLGPKGIAVVNDSVYVADTGHNAIQQFDTNGSFTTLWGTATLSSPDGIAVGTDNSVYVAATGHHCIYKFDSTGTCTGTFTNSFSSPAGIAIDSSGNIYVADTNNSRICKLDSVGTPTLTFGSQGNSNGILISPYASAIGIDGSIYVADASNHQIQRFSATGTFISKWGSFGSATGLFNTPQGIAIDSSGNVYVADSGNNRIQRFTANGTFTKYWTNSLNSPHNIAIIGTSARTYVYVTNTNNNNIEQFDADGGFYNSFGLRGANNGMFNHPEGICINSDGNIYVADTNNNRIQKFTASGSYTAQWGGFGTATGKFNHPTAVSVDHYGYIYVCDSGNHRIQKFSPQGNFITSYGMQGAGTGSFSFPLGVIIGTTSEGHERVYVTDTGNHFIQYFEPTPLTIGALLPASGSNTGTINCTINGAGFFSQVRAELFWGSLTIQGTTTSVLTSGTFTCIFDLTAAKWGTWSLRVINPNGTIAIAATSSIFYIIDPTPPVIAAAATIDKNSDGWLDGIGITFSEPIKDTSVVLTDFSISSVGIPAGSWTGIADDNYFELLFSDGSLTTDVTPSITYTQGSLTDLYGAEHGGNLLGSTTVSTIDSSRPILKVISPHQNGIDNDSVAIEYWLSEPCGSGTVRLMFQGAASATVALSSTGMGTATATVSGSAMGLIDGTYTVALVAVDMANNAGTSNIISMWQYDNTKPTINLVRPAGSSTDNEQIEVEYSLLENVASLTVTFTGTISTTTDLSAKTAGTHSQTLNGSSLGLSPGTYTVSLNAIDLAGNTFSTTNTNWTYDTYPPAITLISPRVNGYDNLKISVEYHLSKDVDPRSLWLMFYSPQDSGSPKKANTIFSGTKGTHTAEIIGTDLLADGNKTTGDYLLDGCVYDVIMTAIDCAGNAGTSGTNTGWTYDNTQPTITMSRPAPDGFDNKSIAVEYRLSEQVSTVTMLFIGSSSVHTVTTTLPTAFQNNFNLGTSSINPPLPEGVSTFTVKLMACDKAGNEATPAVISNWTYDTIISTPTLTLANGSIYTTSQKVEVSVGNDTPDAEKWIISENAGTQPDETSSQWTTTEPTLFQLSSGDGKKTVYVWIKDKAGNISAAGSGTIILDEKSPTITLSQPAANTSNNGSLTITYWLSEGLDTNTIRLAFGTISVASTAFTGNQGTNTVNLNISGIGLTDGATYTLLLTAQDLPGNQGTSNSQVSWQYDITPPVIGLTTNTSDNQSIAVGYTLSENVNPSSLMAAFSRGTFTATATNIGTATIGTWSCILSGSQLGLTDGTYTVTLSAADMAGNPAAPATVSIWTYDTQIGSITMSIPAGSYTNQASIAVVIGTITSQESGTISYLLSETYSSIPSEANGSWSTTKPVSYMLSNGDGTKTLYLWVKDSAGNITPSPATASIMLDTTRPTISLNNPVTSGFGNGSITLSYTLNENVKPASLMLTFVGATIATTTSSSWSGTIGTHELVLNTFNILGTNEGSYTVYLSAEDMAGNTNTSNLSNNWTYDITLPKGTLSIPASNGINNQNIPVFYTLSEQASNVMLKFTQVSGTPDGASPHRVTARLTANNGNNGTITLNGSDLNDDKTTSIDDTLKSDAVYEVYMEIIDRAGNIGSSAVTTNWTYDSQAPIITLIKPVTNGFDNNSIAVEYELSEQVSPSTIKLIFECPSAMTTIPSGSLTVTKGKNSLILYGTVVNLQEGTYSVRMEAVDLAGNKGESNISTGWIYDNTLGTPTVKLADGATYTKTVLVDIAITDDAEAVTWYDSETQKDTPIEDSTYWNSEPSYFVLSKDDGTKTVYVWVKDRAGNIRGGTDTIILDTIPPVVTLNKPAQNGMDNGDIAVDYTVSENQRVASVTLAFTWTGGVSDRNHVIDVTSTTTTTLNGNELPLVIGAIYTVSLQAVDLAGNISIADANTNWKYDPNPPQITLNKPAKDGVDNKSIAVNYTISEAVDPSSIRLIFASGTSPTIHTVTSRFFTGNMDDNAMLLDGAALSIEGTTATVSLIHGATYTVKMSCSDWAGNSAESAFTDNWTYDNQIGTPSCFKIYDQNSGDGSITVSAVVRIEIESATETCGWILSEVQTVQPAESSSSWLETKPAAFQLSVGNGTKTVYLWCKDRAGNISNPATASIKLDTTKDVTPPIISLISPTTNGIDNNSITLSYSLSEPCLTDASLVRLMFGTHTGTVANLTGNYGANSVVVDGTIFGLIDGQTYTVSLSMVDFGENRATSTPVVTNWLYDTQVPSLEFYLKDRLTQGAAYTNSAMVDVVIGTYSADAVNWIISEEHSDTPSESSGPWNSKPIVYSLSSGDGTKTVYLWCKDRAGNIGSGTAVITLDTIKPIITLNSPAQGGVSNENIVLNYSLSEAVVSGTLVLSFTRIGGTTDSSTAHSLTIGSIAAGSHEIMLSGSSLNLKDGAVYAVSLEGLDIAGNRGQVSITNWRYDASIATPTVTLNQGSAYTNVSRVTVSVSNDAEASSWLIGTTSGKPAENDPRWLQEEPITFDIGAVQSTRSVYLWTRDAVGNISATGTAAIVLDTTPATITLTMPSVDNQSISGTYSLSEDAASVAISFYSQTDANSPHQVLLSLGAGSFTLNGLDLNNDGQRTLYDYLKDGATYTVTLTVCDRAGN
ncbi:MAG: SMP-30/gluconolactonase/LRE family protein, partial [bacterium]|nr:SMP-30/gluconolactonase/LRE family protein [bacterium]